MSRRMRLAVALTGVLLVATSCKSKPSESKTPLPPVKSAAPVATPSPTPSPTATPSPSATKPSKTPAPSKPATPKPKPTSPEAQAEAFVEEYFEAMNRAAESGDTDEWSALLLPDCECRASVDFVKRAYAAGHSIRGLRWTLRSVVFQGLVRGDAKVVIEFDVSGWSKVDADGDVLSRHRAFRNAKDVLTLTSVRGAWKLAHVGQVRLGES